MFENQNQSLSTIIDTKRMYLLVELGTSYKNLEIFVVLGANR